MKIMTLLTLLMGITFPVTVFSETLEIEINGMTCAFCVDGLLRKLGKLPEIAQVDVSLKNKKVRIDTGDEKADIDAIKQAIIDSGFTPVKVHAK
ncbi:heavy-metal-associated domain-containing protein [Pseudomaricurvus alkylphenolicus]|uniref:heavy-metal-associated domain-containing protein n=1 Tax=Pseudomaricurvus alkylphenolicus TaxID=1306991 RepID=UPI00141E3508|nr:heavy metal-associated domain-containing protein [Pseudomaricurvus alkylphenolicus]NIB39721.1 heavy-metal-associated domain-containing protein [Pseudomaricurvus alkylphenolicus]